MIHARDKVSEIEAVVNSWDMEKLVAEKFEWGSVLHLIEKTIQEDILPADQEALEDDLYDWWKNGNMTAGGGWELGEWPWWDENKLPEGK